MQENELKVKLVKKGTTYSLWLLENKNGEQRFFLLHGSFISAGDRKTFQIPMLQFFIDPELNEVWNVSSSFVLAEGVSIDENNEESWRNMANVMVETINSLFDMDFKPKSDDTIQYFMGLKEGLLDYIFVNAYKSGIPEKSPWKKKEAFEINVDEE